MTRLSEIESQMAENQNALEAAAFDYFGLKRERDLARAKSLLRQDGGTVAEREARATVEVSSGDIWNRFVAAEASYESLKAAQKSLADRASIGQTLLRTMRDAA